MQTEEINIKAKFPRSVLNEVKWKGFDITMCKIHYISRGSPGDIAIAEGSEIKEIDSGFLILEGVPYEKYIPYHRIKKIEYGDKTIFDHHTEYNHEI